jgi:hypothetical protein
MRIAYTNLLDTASAITATTTELGYPIVNMQDQRLTTTFRTTAATTTQSIIIDLGSAQVINTFAILGHNMMADSTMQVYGNSTISGTATSMIWNATGQSSVETLVYNDDVILKFVQPRKYRYWKFSLKSPTSTAGYIEIGRLWLGTYLTINPSSLLDFSVTLKRSDNVVYGRHRQKYASPGVQWRQFNFSFPETEHTLVASLETMFKAVGNHSSFIFCNFDQIRTYHIVEPCYCSIVGELQFNHVQKMRYQYSLSLEEDK